MTDPTTSAITAPAAASTAPQPAPGGSLGKDDFLRLLATELRYQDPLSPTDDKSFMAQMAQFSALEQMTNVATSVDQLKAEDEFSRAVGLLGHQIGYLRADGSAATGAATSVSADAGTVTLTVGSDQIGLDAITSVTTEPAATAAAADGSASTGSSTP